MDNNEKISDIIWDKNFQILRFLDIEIRQERKKLLIERGKVITALAALDEYNNRSDSEVARVRMEGLLRGLDLWEVEDKLQDELSDCISMIFDEAILDKLLEISEESGIIHYMLSWIGVDGVKEILSDNDYPALIDKLRDKLCDMIAYNNMYKGYTS